MWYFVVFHFISKIFLLGYELFRQYGILLFFILWFHPLISVSVKLFDSIEFSHSISDPCQLLVWNYSTLLLGWEFSHSILTPCQLLVWNYLILLKSLCVCQPGVSCWYTIFDFVEFSHSISDPCQLLVWNYLTLLSEFSLCVSTLCQLLALNYLILLNFFVCQPGVSCWYEPIWLCWVSFLCVY